MSLLIDPITRFPRWDASAQKREPKDEFALESARRLQAGELSLEQLKDHIIAAANFVWEDAGNKDVLRTLNDVKEKVGKSGKDWFFEIQRVFDKPILLQILIEQEGRGLTALSRRAGPIQAQRRKGYSHPRRASSLFDLISTLIEAQRLLIEKEMFDEVFDSENKSDLAKYRNLLKRIK